MVSADPLGGADAVLSLSVRRVNFALYQMLARGDIPSSWRCSWALDHAGNPKFSFADDAVNKYRENPNKAAGCWDATVHQLMLESVPHKPHLFRVVLYLAGGSLYISDGRSGFTTLEFNRPTADYAVYAFFAPLRAVALGEQGAKLTPDGAASVNALAKSRKTNRSAFTIEAIIPDMASATVEKADVGRCRHLGHRNLMANAVAAMFKHGLPQMKASALVLGYSVRPKLVKPGTALLSPTAMRASVTHVRDGKVVSGVRYTDRESSVNFHLMVNNNRPVLNDLPGPLLKDRLEQDERNDGSTIDAVLNVRYSLFGRQVLEDMIEQALRNFMSKADNVSIKNTVPGRTWVGTGSKYERTTNVGFKFIGDDGKTKGRRETRTNISTKAQVSFEDGDIKVTFTVSMGFKVEYRRNKWVRFKYPWRTYGRYERETKTEGRVEIFLSPGRGGSIVIDKSKTTSRDLELKTTVEDLGDLRNGIVNFFANLGDFITGINKALSDTTKFVTGNNNATKGLQEHINTQIDKQGELLNIDGLNVVLPFGNVYAFKDFLYVKKKPTEQSVLVTRLAYAEKREAIEVSSEKPREIVAEDI